MAQIRPNAQDMTGRTPLHNNIDEQQSACSGGTPARIEILAVEDNRPSAKLQRL